MALTLGVNAKGLTGNNTTAPTAAVTTTSGSTLVVGFQCLSTMGATPVTDNMGNTSWVQIGSELVLGGGTRTRVYYHLNIAGGAGHQVSVTVSAVTPITIFLIEIKGTSLEFESGTRQADATSPYTSPTLTPAQANTFLAGFFGLEGAGGAYTHTAGNSFTKLAEEGDGDTYFPGYSSYRIVTSSAAYSTSTTNTGSISDTSNWIVAFREAGGAPPLTVSLAEPTISYSTF